MCGGGQRAGVGRLWCGTLVADAMLERQHHGKRRAMTFAGAGGAQAAAVQIDQLARNRQPQPQSAHAAGGAGIGLTEAVEHMRQEVGGNANASIAYAQAQALLFHLQAHAHIALGCGELERVADQVGQHLLEAPGIAEEPQAALQRRIQFQPDLARLCGGLHQFHGAARQPGDVEVFGLQADLAGQDRTHIQQVVDDLRLRARTALDHHQSLAQLGRLEGIGLHQARPSQDRIERRAQFVAERGQEFILDPAGVFGLIACSGFSLQRGLEFGIHARALDHDAG